MGLARSGLRVSVGRGADRRQTAEVLLDPFEAAQIQAKEATTRAVQVRD